MRRLRPFRDPLYIVAPETNAQLARLGTLGASLFTLVCMLVTRFGRDFTW